VEEPPIGRAKSSTLRAGYAGRSESAGGGLECALIEVTEVRRAPRVQLVNWPYQIWHIGGRTAGKRGVSYAPSRRTQLSEVRLRGVYGIPVSHLDWEPCGESRNALKLPASRQSSWQGVEGLLERKGPNVANHEIMVNVSRR